MQKSLAATLEAGPLSEQPGEKKTNTPSIFWIETVIASNMDSGAKSGTYGMVWTSMRGADERAGKIGCFEDPQL